MKEAFRKFSSWTADKTGNPSTFLLVLLFIVTWACTGPRYHYSDTWQLVVNTASSIVTFLMVFLIQNTQNRDAKAMHLKLDELLRAVKEARTQLVSIEDSSDEVISGLKEELGHIKRREGGEPASPDVTKSITNR